MNVLNEVRAWLRCTGAREHNQRTARAIFVERRAKRVVIELSLHAKLAERNLIGHPFRQPTARSIAAARPHQQNLPTLVFHLAAFL